MDPAPVTQLLMRYLPMMERPSELYPFSGGEKLSMGAESAVKLLARCLLSDLQWALDEGYGLARRPSAADAADALTRSIEIGPYDVVRLPASGISLDEIEKQAILSALERCHWVQKDAADLLRTSPRVLNYKIQSHGIWRPFADRGKPKEDEAVVGA